NRLPGKPQSIFISLAGPAPIRVDGAGVQINGVKVLGWFALRPLHFRPGNARRDCPHYAGCDLVLQRKDVIQRSIKPVTPQMGTGSGLDELAGDTDLGASLSDTAFEHIANPKLASNLLDIDGFALVGEARITRDDE